MFGNRSMESWAHGARTTSHEIDHRIRLYRASSRAKLGYMSIQLKGCKSYTGLYIYIGLSIEGYIS